MWQDEEIAFDDPASIHSETSVLDPPRRETPSTVAPSGFVEVEALELLADRERFWFGASIGSLTVAGILSGGSLQASLTVAAWLVFGFTLYMLPLEVLFSARARRVA